MAELSSQNLHNVFNTTRQKLGTAVDHIYDHIVPSPDNNFHPLALRHRALWLLSALLIVVKLGAIFLLTYAPPLPVYSSAITVENILTLTNESRRTSGVAALTLNNQLTQAAQAKANDMLAKQYFAHTTPDGHSPWDFITAAGYQYQAAGENLAVNFLQAEEVTAAWMDSPGHRANLLNSTFKDIGIGIASGNFQGNNVTFVVQEFGTPLVVAASQAPTPAPAPKPAPTPAPAPKPTPTPTPTPVATAPAIISAPLQVDIRGPQSTLVTLEGTNPAVAITSATAQLLADQLNVAVATSSSAQIVEATVGGKSFPLTLVDNLWQGTIPLAQLAGATVVTVKAVDGSGNSTFQQIAGFANSIQKNYNALSQNTDTLVNYFGVHLNTRQFQQTFYSLFIAALRFLLMLAIAIRPRIQYLSMVAHTSVVVILATLLLISN